VEEVAHRGSLAQELWVRDDLDVRAAKRALDEERRADRDRRLVDDQPSALWGVGTQR
jgi:hypothetical protein